MVTFTNSQSSSELTQIKVISVIIIVSLLLSAAYSAFLIIIGSYKLIFLKNNRSKLLGRKQLVRGVLILLILFLVWYMINTVGTFY